MRRLSVIKDRFVMASQNPMGIFPWLLVTAFVSYLVCLFSELFWLWWFIIFGFLLVFPAFEDLETGYISDGWSLIIGVTGILWQYCAGYGLWELWGSLVVVLFIGSIYLMRRDAIGEGDIWLSGAIACWLSGWESFLFLWLAFVLGGIVGIYRLLAGGTMKESMPFGPFLCASGMITYIFGGDVLVWYGSFF